MFWITLIFITMSCFIFWIPSRHSIAFLIQLKFIKYIFFCMRTLRFNDVRDKVLKFILEWSLSSWVFLHHLSAHSLTWWSQLYGRIPGDTMPLSLHRSPDFQKNNLSWSLVSDNHCPFQFPLPQSPVTQRAQSPPLWPFPWTNPSGASL